MNDQHDASQGGAPTPASDELVVPGTDERPRVTSQVLSARRARPLVGIIERLAAHLASQGFAIRGALSLPAASPAEARTIPEGDNVPEEQHLVLSRFEIPIHDNEGRPFDLDLLARVLVRVLKIARGASLLEQVGLWESNDTLSIDVSIVVEVWTRAPAALADLLRSVAQELQQDCVMLRHLRGVEFVVLEPVVDGTRGGDA